MQHHAVGATTRIQIKQGMADLTGRQKIVADMSVVGNLTTKLPGVCLPCFI